MSTVTSHEDPCVFKTSTFASHVHSHVFKMSTFAPQEHSRVFKTSTVASHEYSHEDRNVTSNRNMLEFSLFAVAMTIKTGLLLHDN